MRRVLLAALLTACASAADRRAGAQGSVAEAAGRCAAHYVVVSMAGKHGDQWALDTCPTARSPSRYSQSLRGWITETDEVMTLGADGLPTKIAIRGVTPNGDAAETFTVADGKASWTAPRTAAKRRPRRLLPCRRRHQPGQHPAGRRRWSKAGPNGRRPVPERPGDAGQRAERSRSRGPNGPKTVQLAWLRGILPSPTPVWLDDQGQLFRRGRLHLDHARGL